MKANLSLATKEFPQFEIESGIDIPTRKRPNPYNDLFSKMKVNDSFLIGQDQDVVAKVKYYAAKYAQENKASFAYRATEDGVRIWRKE